MPRLEPAELANQARPKQVKVADGIEDLVFDEFVFVTQAVFIEHMVLVDHDRVLHAAAERQIVRAKKFNVAHEPEGPRTADFLDEGSTGEIHASRLGTTLEDR